MLSCLEASLGLILSSLICAECEFFLVSSDEESGMSCVSCFSVVSSPKLAGDLEMCSEVWMRVSLLCVCVCSVHGEQCVQLIMQSFSNVSKSVEQHREPKMSSGSWQSWSV